MLNLSNISNSKNLKNDVTFVDAKNEPIHNWFPYLEGFSETFIENIIKSLNKKPQFIYEPFSGSGTLPVFCKKNNINCFYSEVNPFLVDLSELKLKVFDLDKSDRLKLSKEIVKISSNLVSVIEKLPDDKHLDSSYKNVFEKSIYFEEDNYNKILKLSSFCKSIEDPVLLSLIKVSICNCLLPSSFLKRAGDIRFKRGKEKENIPNILDLLSKKLKDIAYDLKNIEAISTNSKTSFNLNSKIYNSHYSEKIDTIITSPPYLNGTNYIRNTKLELWFLGYLELKKDLSKYRKEVVTSGINDVSRQEKNINIPYIQDILDDSSLWYDKRIPKMITDYFFDMNIVIENFYKYLKKGGYVFLDIGDSVYANKHIPTDLILLNLFKNNGFDYVENLKLRNRRSKSGKIVKQCLLVLRK